MNLTLLIDIVGWMGAAAVLAAYLLVSAKKLEGDAPVYQILTLAGAIFLLTNTFFYGAYPSSWVNIVWAGIAIYTLARKRWTPAAN